MLPSFEVPTSIQCWHWFIAFIICVQTAFINGDTTISKLFETIQRSQIKHDSEFSLLPFSWKAIKGIYPSDVKLNFHGDLQYYLVRDEFNVPDVNMFTPAWVTSCLIEAYEYGKAPKPSSDQVQMALAAIDKFRNHNVPYNNSEMTFWQQELNTTSKYYESSPKNLLEVLRLPDYMPDKLIEEILGLMGLEHLEEILKKLVREKDIFVEAFRIPPDFDDTFVNIGVGSLLSQFEKDFPEDHKTWISQNNNLKSVFDKVKKYAYRPFSSFNRESTIDPRTYMYLHKFIETAASNNQDVALITTWLQDTDEVKTQLDKGVAMPFNVNNVDITVAANFLYGVVTCLGSGTCSPELVDKDVQKIFMNTTALVVHEIGTNLSSRPDLALTYYPSKFEFYWFVSRTYAFLNRFLEKLPVRRVEGLMEMMSYAYMKLGPVLREQMTADIVNSVHHVPEGGYVDNFLGNGDINIFNQSINRAEDRLFTTAMSINALINTWTKLVNGTLHWEPDAPVSVKSVIGEMAEWLDKNVVSSTYKPLNTFFSGSGKGLKSMPFFYPANRMEYFNGTKFDDKHFPMDIHNIIGMQGAVTQDQYAAMLEQPHFGKMTPMTFDGYNSEDGGFFPFWSSNAYTYATSLVALAHYENIQN